MACTDTFKKGVVHDCINKKIYVYICRMFMQSNPNKKGKRCSLFFKQTLFEMLSRLPPSLVNCVWDFLAPQMGDSPERLAQVRLLAMISCSELRVAQKLLRYTTARRGIPHDQWIQNALFRTQLQQIFRNRGLYRNGLRRRICTLGLPEVQFFGEVRPYATLDALGQLVSVYPNVKVMKWIESQVKGATARRRMRESEGMRQLVRNALAYTYQRYRK
jgi:hypothetical protein